MVDTRLFLAGAALVTALAGCGDDESAASGLGSDEQQVADNLAAQIVRSGDVSGDGSGVTEEQASCIAEGAVGEVGLESLQEYGIVTEDLLVDKSIQGVEMSAADADALAAVFVECIDAEMLFEQRFVKAARPTDQVRSCIEDAVEVEQVREILAASFRGGSTKAFRALQRAVAACNPGSREAK